MTGAGQAPGPTILLVDDEELLRDLAQEILEAHGYRVLVARDGAHALVVAERHGAPLDLLLTDVTMPGMSGREVAERLSASRPALRVLYMTGYTDDPGVRRGLADATAVLLTKPFTPDRLLGRVRDALGAATPPVRRPPD